MPAGNPLIEDMPGEVPNLFGASASAQALGVSAGGQVGVGLDGAEHETQLWVAGLILFGLLGLVVFHITGFRFATDVGVTRG